MELDIILIFYAIILFTLTIIIYKCGIKLFSSFIMSTIISLILLILLKPPNSIDLEYENKSSYAFYVLILFFTPILVFIYALIMSSKDRYLLKKCCFTNYNDTNFINVPQIF